MSNCLHKKYSRYRYCIVRECKNTSIKAPEKLWIKVPSEPNMRNTWLRLAQRDPESLSTKTIIYLCEDHFNLEIDMLNYLQYKIMNSVKMIKMRPGCVPSRFESHSNIKRKYSADLDEPEDVDIKPGPIELSTSTFKEEILDKENVLPSCSSSLTKFSEEVVHVVQHNNKFVQAHPIHQDVSCQIKPRYEYKVTQTIVTRRYRSKGVQFNGPAKYPASSQTEYIPHQSPTTTPIKLQRGKISKPNIFGESFSKKIISTEEKYDSHSSTSQTTIDSLQENIIEDRKLILQSTLTKIRNKPNLYIGIPAEQYFLVSLISKHTNLSEVHILLCLMKIKLNKTFSEMADDFDVSLPQVKQIFYNKIPLIVGVLSPFIKTFPKSTIKRNLPIVFRYKYYQTDCIIYCLEIEIQKPKKAIHQAFTWSEYKKAYTFKYLIACTPDGLVSFVSTGYGGRISDINLLEKSKFLKTLEPNSYILADRHFKNIEMYLKKRGFTLLKPPSVGSKSTKSKERQINEIASLRIHVEKILRRIQEFSFLKPHSVVNLNSLHVLDSCVIIACALNNLQDSVSK